MEWQQCMVSSAAAAHAGTHTFTHAHHTWHNVGVAPVWNKGAFPGHPSHDLPLQTDPSLGIPTRLHDGMSCDSVMGTLGSLLGMEPHKIYSETREGWKEREKEMKKEGGRKHNLNNKGAAV